MSLVLTSLIFAAVLCLSNCATNLPTTATTSGTITKSTTAKPTTTAAAVVSTTTVNLTGSTTDNTTNSQLSLTQTNLTSSKTNVIQLLPLLVSVPAVAESRADITSPLNLQCESKVSDPFGLKIQFNADGILLLHTTTTTTTTTTTPTTTTIKPVKQKPPKLNEILTVREGSAGTGGDTAGSSGSDSSGGMDVETAGGQDALLDTVQSHDNMPKTSGLVSDDILLAALNPKEKHSPANFNMSFLNRPRQVVPRMLRKREAGKVSLGKSRQSRSGFEALPNQICWQARITATVRISTGRFAKFNCGGSIIGAATIITSAHCVTNPFSTNGTQKAFLPGQLTIRLGDRSDQCTSPKSSKNFTSGLTLSSASDNGITSGADPSGSSTFLGDCSTETYGVTKIIRHPDYSPILADNDLALLILSKPIRPTLCNPSPCALCLRAKAPEVDEQCIITGSAEELDMTAAGTHVPDPFPSTTKWLSLQVRQASLTSSNCGFNVDDTTGKSTDLEKFICAGGLKNQESCVGDSGGALVCLDPRTSTHYLAGVASFMPPCGVAIGAMYSKTSRFLPWIIANSGSDVSLP